MNLLKNTAAMFAAATLAVLLSSTASARETIEFMAQAHCAKNLPQGYSQPFGHARIWAYDPDDRSSGGNVLYRHSAVPYRSVFQGGLYASGGKKIANMQKFAYGETMNVIASLPTSPGWKWAKNALVVKGNFYHQHLINNRWVNVTPARWVQSGTCKRNNQVRTIR